MANIRKLKVLNKLESASFHGEELLDYLSFILQAKADLAIAPKAKQIERTNAIPKKELTFTQAQILADMKEKRKALLSDSTEVLSAMIAYQSMKQETVFSDQDAHQEIADTTDEIETVSVTFSSKRAYNNLEKRIIRSFDKFLSDYEKKWLNVFQNPGSDLSNDLTLLDLNVFLLQYTSLLQLTTETYKLKKEPDSEP